MLFRLLPVLFSNYNGIKNNCATYARVGIEAALGHKIPATETLTNKVKSTTPNKLYNSTSRQENTRVIKSAGDKVKNSYINGVTGGGLSNKVAEKLNSK